MKKLSRPDAVRLKCIDCAGDSPKEVTLCQVFDCPLWRYRCGYSVKSPQYKKRMESAKVNFVNEFRELQAQGINTSCFFEN